MRRSWPGAVHGSQSAGGPEPRLVPPSDSVPPGRHHIQRTARNDHRVRFRTSREEGLKVAILHQHVPENAGNDELDLLDELQIVGDALAELGHETTMVTFSLDLQGAVADLSRRRPDL